jgi:hypothetical protein
MKEIAPKIPRKLDWRGETERSITKVQEEEKAQQLLQQMKEDREDMLKPYPERKKRHF